MNELGLQAYQALFRKTPYLESVRFAVKPQLAYAQGVIEALELLRYNQVVDIGRKHIRSERMADACGTMNWCDICHSVLFI